MQDIDWKQFGLDLKKGQGQRRACERLGIPEGSLCKMIFNNSTPQLKTLQKIARAEGIPLHELIRRIEDEYKKATDQEMAAA
jgi:transcriptional regulator with XRE-family HTH domain